MKKKLLSLVLASTMIAGLLVGCGSSQQASSDASSDAAATTSDAATSSDAATASDASASSGDVIKVGIINNDPNESGYRTANDKSMKEMFTAENGYEASFAYSLKNDEQITAAQKFIRTVLITYSFPQLIQPAGTQY